MPHIAKVNGCCLALARWLDGLFIAILNKTLVYAHQVHYHDIKGNQVVVARILIPCMGGPQVSDLLDIDLIAVLVQPTYAARAQVKPTHVCRIELSSRLYGVLC